MKRFLSWDCANKTLAWVHFTINTNIHSESHGLMQKILDVKTIEEKIKLIAELEKLTKNFVCFHSYGVRDILNGKLVSETSEVDRTKALYKFLTENSVSHNAINKIDADGIKTKVLIEHQPSKVGFKTNNKSTLIQHQLMFYYVDFEVFTISPKHKNNLSLSPEHTLAVFIGASTGYKNQKDAAYNARKSHSRESFKYFLEHFDCEFVLKGIVKSKQDDIADAFMQTLAYIYL